MNKNRTQGLTIGELKKNLHILDAFAPNMEVSKFIELFEQWVESLAESEYEKVLTQIKDGTCNTHSNWNI